VVPAPQDPVATPRAVVPAPQDPVGAPQDPVAVPRLPAALAATAVLLLLVGWFAVELSGAGRTGLAERVAAGAEAVCPLLVAARARTAAHRARDVV
jgi:hypothetical protein